MHNTPQHADVGAVLVTAVVAKEKQQQVDHPSWQSTKTTAKSNTRVTEQQREEEHQRSLRWENNNNVAPAEGVTIKVGTNLELAADCFGIQFWIALQLVDTGFRSQTQVDWNPYSVTFTTRPATITALLCRELEGNATSVSRT